MNISTFDALDDAGARDLLCACANIESWAASLADQRPFGSLEALMASATAAAEAWTSTDILTALADHPRIGEKHGGSGLSAELSAAEQAGATTTDDMANGLLEGNRAYEAKFDRVFLIRAAGRDSVQILAELNRRLHNDDATELKETSRELREIALLRLGGLFR